MKLKPENQLCPRCKVPYGDHACYFHPCLGCKDGHPSFWKTVIESPQWTAWHKKQRNNLNYDIAEVEEGGIISPKHFQEFLEFAKTLS